MKNKSLWQTLRSALTLLCIVAMWRPNPVAAQCDPVIIPDINFQFYLLKNYPSVMTADKKLLPCKAAEVKSVHMMIPMNSNITNLSGIEHFVQLEQLMCYSMGLKLLPALPPKLMELNCSQNQLTALPPLPETLDILDCSQNQLAQLPALPIGMLELFCYQNKLTALPTLPLRLKKLDCNQNQLYTMPKLPPYLVGLACATNKLQALPDLPATLRHLYCSGNPGYGKPGFPQNFQFY